jgi:hypothetical protein
VGAVGSAVNTTDGSRNISEEVVTRTGQTGKSDEPMVPFAGFERIPRPRVAGGRSRGDNEGKQS